MTREGLLLNFTLPKGKTFPGNPCIGKTILRAVPPRHPVNQITQLSSAPLPDLAYADRPCEHERWRWLLGGGLTFSFLFSGRRTTFLYDQLYSQHSKVLDAP